MTRFLKQVGRFLSELRRRNVYQVALAYLAASFVAVELAEIASGAFGLPGWFEPMVWVLCGIGFLIALVMAWALEVTPDGEVRTEEGKETVAEGARAQASARANLGSGLWIGVSLLAVVLLGAWWFIPSSAEHTEEPQVGERSIAVLPFEAHGQEAPGAFTEGMHDDLLTRLSKVSDLEVISRTSVERYRDTDLSLPAIADSLGAKWIVEGGVQEAGDQIQINVQLIDPRSDTHAWADNYQRELSAENLFAIQGEIAGEIAGALQAQLTPGEQERVVGAPTENLDAYRLYVQGRNILVRGQEGYKEAIGYFERALKEDSTYALAWAGLADARLFYAQHRAESGKDYASVLASLPKVRAAARRALELAPNLAEAWTSLGHIYRTEHRVTPEKKLGPEALQAFRRAVELRPSYAQAHQSLGLLLFDLGRPEPALEHLQLAVDLNPELRDAQRLVTEPLLANGQCEEALAKAREALEEYSRGGPLWELLALAHLKRWEEVRQIADRYLRETEDPDDNSIQWARTYLALADAASGDTASARGRLKQLRSRYEDFGTTRAALIQAALGNKEAALSALRAPYEEGGRPGIGHERIVRYLFPDILGPIREDPRYKELIGNANEWWGLNPDGSLPENVEFPVEISRR